jgi:serine/threonine-protein kinase
VVASPVRVLGRYALYDEIASGGMATVHFGRLIGPVGFTRTVAIKRLHPQFAKDPEFVSMFLDEARLAARIRHPNVVQTVDVVATEGELFLVMDYVQGESLARLVRLAKQRKERIPPRIVAAVVSGALHGLHAAHEAKNERGEPLGLVHRDVSPQNVLVGADGISRVLDFGVAKASGRLQTTREGHLKGKIAYMAPEQFRGEATRATDVYAAGILVWEALTGEKLFASNDEMSTLGKALMPEVAPPSSRVAELAPAFDVFVARALAIEPTARYATAREAAVALERCEGIASPSEVGDYVSGLAEGALAARAETLSGIESSSPLIEMDAAKLTSALARGSKPPDAIVPAEPPTSEVERDANAKAAASPASIRSVAGVESALSTRPEPRGRGVLAAIVGVLVIVVGVLAWRLGTSAPAPEAAAPQPPSAAPTVAPAETKPPATETAAAAATEEPAPRAAPAAAPTADKSAGHKPAAPHAAAPAKKRDCDPPYTIDGSGHKHFKVDCL